MKVKNNHLNQILVKNEHFQFDEPIVLKIQSQEDKM